MGVTLKRLHLVWKKTKQSLDSILINLITFFLSAQPVNVIYHECYTFRDSLTEIKFPSCWPEDSADFNGIFIPPCTIHIATWCDYPEQYWYELKTTHKVKRLLGWQRFKVFFTAIHELMHFQNYLEGCYPDEDEIDLQAEELIKERFEEIRGIIE